MKKYIPAFCLVCCLLAISFIANAQTNVSMDSLKARYEQETIHFFRGYPAKGKNGERIRMVDMKKEFAISPEALDEYSLSVRKRNTAIILIGTALVSIVTGGAISQTNKGLAGGLILGGLVADLASIPFSISASKLYQHAIWLRNRDAVFH